MALALARVSLVDEFNLSSVHLVFIAGASTPPEAITGLKTRLGVDIVIGLGVSKLLGARNPRLFAALLILLCDFDQVTETMSTIDCLPGKYCPESSIGKVNSEVEIKTLNDDGREVEDGQRGAARRGQEKVDFSPPQDLHRLLGQAR